MDDGGESDTSGGTVDLDSQELDSQELDLQEARLEVRTSPMMAMRRSVLMVDSMLPEVVIVLRLEVVVGSAHVVVGSARFAERWSIRGSHSEQNHGEHTTHVARKSEHTTSRAKANIET